MHLNSLLAASAAAPLVVLGHPSLASSSSSDSRSPSNYGQCGSERISEAQLSTISQLASHDADFSRGSRHSALTSAPPTLSVPTHLHAVVAANATDSEMTRASLLAQFDVLKESFAPNGIDLVLKTATRRVDDAASTFDFELDPSGVGIVAAPAALESHWRETRTGGYGELHLYFYSAMAAPGLLGLCSFPNITAPIGGAPYMFDACHVLGDTMPGGAEPFGLGTTA